MDIWFSVVLIWVIPQNLTLHIFEKTRKDFFYKVNITFQMHNVSTCVVIIKSIENQITILTSQEYAQTLKIFIRPPLTQPTFSEFYGCAAHGFYRYQKVMCQIFLKLLENSGRTGISKSM